MLPISHVMTKGLLHSVANFGSNVSDSLHDAISNSLCTIHNPISNLFSDIGNAPSKASEESLLESVSAVVASKANLLAKIEGIPLEIIDINHIILFWDNKSIGFRCEPICRSSSFKKGRIRVLQ